MFRKLKTYAPLQAVTAATAFITIGIHTRFFSLELYGLLAVLLVLTEFFVVSLTQWVSATMIRFYSTASNKLKLIGDSIFLLAVSVFAGIFLVVIASDIVLNVVGWQVDDSTKLLIILLFISKSVYNVFLEIVRVVDNLRVYSFTVISQNMMLISLSLLLLSIEQSVNAALLSFILSYLVSLLIALRAVANPAAFSLKFDRKLIRYGLPLMVSSAVVFLSNRSDRMILAQLTNASEVGLYAGLAGISVGVGSLVFMIVALPLYPELAKHACDRTSLLSMQKKYSKFILAFTMPILVLLGIVADTFIPIILGSKFAQVDVNIFYMLLAATFFYNIKVHYVDHAFQFSNKTFSILILSITAFILLVLASFSLVPEMGPAGLSLSVLLSSFVSLCFALILIYFQKLPLGFSYENFKVLFSLIVSYAICASDFFIIEDAKLLSVLITVIVFLSSYSLILFMTNFAGLKSLVVRKLHENF